MFRPGFNDIVNEAMRTGCNACILSELYNTDNLSREQFLRTHARDVNGVLWFELQRRKDSIYYMRMDGVDVQMYHPDAWGFPDTSRLVTASPGEPIDPFHGWYAQNSINAEKEIADVDFLYTLRLRAFPEKFFQALSLGKLPDWVDPYASVTTEEKDLTEEVPESKKKAPTKIEIDSDMMRAAGLDVGEDVVRVQVGKDGKLPNRTLAPEVLDSKIIPFTIKGSSAMRIYMRSRANPDNMKQSFITPKIVKDMSAQLGIRHEPNNYWYCMFALRYPLAPEWEVLVRDDTRWYLHLPTDRLQPVHPMIRQFRDHLDDCKQNEFLWEFREPPVVKFKCADCGMPDSIVWCMQCTDYFCAPCFFQAHRSARGKKHWPLPIPGTRYLTASEAARLRDHLPLLNVGFSNRRRFLAREEQSDKNGSRNGDPWLFFHADTFQQALQQAPEKHWFLKRLKPPRLAPGVEGYYYNFANDVIADDASHILTKAHEQRALSLLQKNIRGAITRRRIKKENQAVRVIQGAKRMWDVRKVHGKNGENGNILRKWYGKHKSKQDKEMLEYRMSRVQAIFAGFEVRRDFSEMLHNVRKFQANFRGLMGRRKHSTLLNAAHTIQRFYRGRIYGRTPMREQHEGAAKIQAMAKGVARRELERKWARNAAYIQAHARGMLSRNIVRRMHSAGLKIQSNWRRFQAQLDVKIILYERLEQVRQRRLELVREKLEDSAALLIQRNWCRHRDYQNCVFVKREKGEADKRTSTFLVAMFSGASAMRHFVHPWFRHLPRDIQEVLMQIKASMQRTIGLVPVTGKLANEEIGRRGLRAGGKQHLEYSLNGREEIDLASHMLLGVSRHLLSHLPANQFASTIKWGCYAVGHQAVALDKTIGTFSKDVIPVGKDPTLPPHPGDTLATLWEDMGSVKHHHDWLLTTPEESLSCLILHGLPSHHRHVFLTAQILVTMRQALDAPSISTDDHLKFQGLDAGAGAQLMEVLGSEIDHRLPLDWPKMYGTVATLANAACSHLTDLKPSGKGDKKSKKEEPAKEEKTSKTPAKAKAKGSSRGGAKSKAKMLKPDKMAETLSQISEAPEMSALPELPVGGMLSHFNRHAVLRIVQQVGYYMREDRAMQAVLAENGSDGATGGLRQSRYISVVDKLFEMADRAKHDHCSFILAVVLFHMVLRALMLRVLYHRAAIAIQKRYRYLRNKGMKERSIAPAIRIQRFWRGLRAALRLMRMDDAAERIQSSYRAWQWNRRSRRLNEATLRIQRVWHSSVHRKWLHACYAAACKIQRFTRGMLVRWSLDKIGRDMARRSQEELIAVMQRKSQMAESLYVATTAALAARARVALHQHRQRNIEKHRMESTSSRPTTARQLDKQKRLRMKGAIQPARESVFEPMIFALMRLDPRISASAKYGSRHSRILPQIEDARRKLNRYLPPKSQRVAPFHASSKRGRAAVTALRLAKKAPRTHAMPLSDDGLGPLSGHEFHRWMTVQFAIRDG